MNLYTVEHHKEKFYSKVLEMQASKGKNSRMISRANNNETLVRLKELEDLSRHKTLADFGNIRCHKASKMFLIHYQNKN